MYVIVILLLSEFRFALECMFSALWAASNYAGLERLPMQPVHWTDAAGKLPQGRWGPGTARMLAKEE